MCFSRSWQCLGKAPDSGVADADWGDILPDLDQAVSEVLDDLWWNLAVSDTPTHPGGDSLGAESDLLSEEQEGQTVATMKASRNRAYTFCSHEARHCPALGGNQVPLHQSWHLAWWFYPSTWQQSLYHWVWPGGLCDPPRICFPRQWLTHSQTAHGDEVTNSITLAVMSPPSCQSIALTVNLHSSVKRTHFFSSSVQLGRQF